MFKKGLSPSSSDRRGQSILHEGVSIRGEIDVVGDIRVDGHLDGKISASERLTVGSTGNLQAAVEASDLLVMGTITGSVRAHGRVELKSGSRVVGDIAAPSLVIEDGAFFRGRSVMGPELQAVSLANVEPANRDVPRTIEESASDRQHAAV